MRQFVTCHSACIEEPQHRHGHAYAALVLDGEYEEVSVDGRFLCRRGDIVLHPPLHAHANAFGSKGASVLNIALPASALALDCYAVLSGCDPEALTGFSSARDALREISAKASRATARTPPAWMEGLAERLRQDANAGTSTPLAKLAQSFGVSVQHASRAFAAYFGVSPVRFRQEHRLRVAYRQLRAGHSPSTAAGAAGFADQSHLTRELKHFAGVTPAELRR
jgi:AraC-like DNA-binding protein